MIICSTSYDTRALDAYYFIWLNTIILVVHIVNNVFNHHTIDFYLNEMKIMFKLLLLLT